MKAQTSRSNRPFAQLLPGLETGHPVTVGQSPACSFSVSDGREVLFLSPFRAVLSAIHVQVTDPPSPDAPSLTQANNCANGLLIDFTFPTGTHSPEKGFPSHLA